VAAATAQTAVAPVDAIAAVVDRGLGGGSPFGMKAGKLAPIPREE